MKKAVSVTMIIILTAAIFSSCSNIETVELNSRLIIESIGVDIKKERYEVTIEGLDSKAADIGDSDFSSLKLTKCYFYECDTIGEAIDELRMQTGLIPLFSQTRVVVLGRETAEKKLNETLNFFMREYTTRIDILVAVSENSAKDVISANYGDNISAGRHIEETVESYKHTGTSVYAPLYKLINSITNETDAVFCPMLKLSKKPFKDAMQIELNGTIAFAKNKKSLTLDKEQTLALMIITNEIKKGYMIVGTEKGKCTLKIVESKIKTKTKIGGDKVYITISADLSFDIPEFQTDGFSDITKEDTDKIAAAAAEKITGNVSATLDYVFFQNNFDIFEFGRRINLKDRNFYKNNIRKNPEFSKNVTCFINVNVLIRRTGKIILKNQKKRTVPKQPIS